MSGEQLLTTATQACAPTALQPAGREGVHDLPAARVRVLADLCVPVTRHLSAVAKHNSFRKQKRLNVALL